METLAELLTIIFFGCTLLFFIRILIIRIMEKEKTTPDLTFEESQAMEILLYNQMQKLQVTGRDSAITVYKNLEQAIRNLSIYKLEVMSINSAKKECDE